MATGMPKDRARVLLANSPDPAQKVSPASSFPPLLLHSEHFFDLFDGRRVFRRFVFPNEADQSREAQCETDSFLILCASVDVNLAAKAVQLRFHGAASEPGDDRLGARQSFRQHHPRRLASARLKSLEGATFSLTKASITSPTL